VLRVEVGRFWQNKADGACWQNKADRQFGRTNPMSILPKRSQREKVNDFNEAR